jgi:hypothetical protein
MTPLEHTLITVLCLYVTYRIGDYYGAKRGGIAMLQALEDQGVIEFGEDVDLED